MSSYRARVGPENGPIRWHELAFSIGVLEGAAPMPVGVAPPVGWDDQGRTVFALTVRGEELPGRYVVVDRAFVEAAEAS